MGCEIAPATFNTICVIFTPPHMSPTVSLGANDCAFTDAVASRKERESAKYIDPMS